MVNRAPTAGEGMRGEQGTSATCYGRHRLHIATPWSVRCQPLADAAAVLRAHHAGGLSRSVGRGPCSAIDADTSDGQRDRGEP